jgi:hypothetical protein
MKLSRGCRLVVAPHFHLSGDWSRRVSLGTGVKPSAEGPGPQPSWRPASDEELTALVLDPTQPTAREELADCLCLFTVPAHLRATFWGLLAAAREQGEVPPEGFNAFVAQVAQFLAFKQLPVPVSAVFDLIVSSPGQAPVPGSSPLWGLINLGEDPASLVFVNVPAEDCPPVRIALEPGEGLRFPRDGVLVSSDSVDREQPDLLLVVRPPAAATPAPVSPDLPGHGEIGGGGRPG